MIWAVLQCHPVVASFSDVQFRGHSSIVKEMSLFMLIVRVDPTELVGMLQRVRDAEAAAASAKAEVKKLSDIFTPSTTQASSLKIQHNDSHNLYKQTNPTIIQLRAIGVTHTVLLIQPPYPFPHLIRYSDII